MTTQRYLYFAVVVLFQLSWNNSAFAFQASYRSYKRVSSNGRYVLVMLWRDSYEDEDSNWKSYPETGKELQAIHEKYSISGMYTNDGSTTPLWTVDWFCPGVSIASDGIHMVSFGWPRSCGTIDAEDVGLLFYARGKLIQTYRLRDLVDEHEHFPWSESRPFFYWFKDFELDDSTMELSVETKEGHWFAFDVRTGEIKRKIRHRTAILWGSGTIGVALCAFLILRWRGRTRPDRGRSDTETINHEEP